MNTGLILIILLLCCCIILLIGGFGFFLFKTSEEEEGTPTITLDDVTVEAEVEEESTTENYTYDELSKNIKLNIKWSNGSDFDDVANVYLREHMVIRLKKRKLMPMDEKVIQLETKFSLFKNLVKICEVSIQLR